MKFQMLGSADKPGPVRLSDVYNSQVGDASMGIAASQKALYDAYNSLNSSLKDRYSGKLLTSSDNLNNYYGSDKTGLYVTASGVQNAALDWAGLLVSGSTGSHQMQFNSTGLHIRSYTGSPLAWTSWAKVPFVTAGNWTPQLYDYETYLRSFASQSYYKIGSLYVMFINANNLNYSGVNTMI